MNELPGNIIFLYILVYYKWRSYDIQSSWNIRCNRQKFLSFWAIFCPFSRLTTWKINIFKLKKTPGDIIILHIFTINDNYMKYGSWDMERSRQNFFVILDRFLYFYPPNNSKNQNFIKMKKKKKAGDIIILHKCTKNHDHMLYCSFDMGLNGCNFYLHFGLFFALLPP